MGKFTALLLVFAPLAMADSLPVFDQDFACTSQAKANQYVTDFGVDLQSFGGMELCNASVDSKKLFNDLSLIEDGRFAGKAVNYFVQDLVPANGYYAFMKSETRGMQRGNDVPYATAYNSGGYFTMQNGWTKLSTLGRVGTVIHEARHSEGYGHRGCTHGPYQDSSVSGCDQNIVEGGAHAVEMEYYARVALQSANLHPVYRSMARLMLLARANFVFNENPMTESTGLLALTQNGLIRITGKKTQTLALAPNLPANSVLKRTSFGAALLNLPHEAYAIDLLETAPQARFDDDYSYFKMLKTLPPANLADLEEVDIGTQRFLFAGTQPGQVMSYDFPNGQWSQPRSTPGFLKFHTVSPDGREGIFATLAGGSYCQIDAQSLACQGAIKAWPAQTKTLVKFKNEALTLGTDGVVRHFDGSVLTELQNEKVLDLVSVPQYNALE
ncbi:MAG: hypothetical protein ACXVA9_12885 [Bdellovibrionales bacterium]